MTIAHRYNRQLACRPESSCCSSCRGPCFNIELHAVRFIDRTFFGTVFFFFFFKSSVLPFQPDSGEGKEASECSKEQVQLFCVRSREELTSSICLKWRQLKSHVERLDGEGNFRPPRSPTMTKGAQFIRSLCCQANAGLGSRFKKRKGGKNRCRNVASDRWGADLSHHWAQATAAVRFLVLVFYFFISSYPSISHPSAVRCSFHPGYLSHISLHA